MLKEIKGTYGSGKTQTTIFVYNRCGINWYVCEGSKNINATYEELSDGVDVEMLQDVDIITSLNPITSLSELEEAVDN